MKESRVFGMKKIMLGKRTRFRYILMVCREKEFYQKQTIGIWWKLSKGLGLIENPKKQIKYFMFGISFFHILAWVDVKWIGKADKSYKLLIKDI